MIRTSTHHFGKFVNEGKSTILADFLDEYRTAVEYYVDHLWKTLPKSLVIGNFISTKSLFPSHTRLSQRALKCASTQACGIVSAATEKRRKQMYVLRREMRNGNATRFLQRKIDRFPLVKPTIPKTLPAELNSICVDFKTTSGEFDGYFQLKSLGKQFQKIRIPIRFTRHSNRLHSQGHMKSSFLVQANAVHIRWEISDPKPKNRGKIVGGDQGIVTCLTLSDGQITRNCPHNHDLSTILERLSRCRKGSKGFQRAQRHRTNYINWAINQLDLTEIKEIRLERLYRMRDGQPTTRFISHFTYTAIRDKIIDVCQRNGVRFIEQNCIYRSQRCSNCGYVHKSNRKGKTFTCIECGFTLDADLNAARNHEVDLVELPFDIRRLNLNRTGLFWLPDRLLDSLGEELTVPLVPKSN